MDMKFYKERAQPYISDVAKFAYAMNGDLGNRKPLLSSSPEYHDNSINAWFKNYTNYDLALLRNMGNMDFDIKFHFSHGDMFFDNNRGQFPDYDINETGLTIAPGQNLDESHRHHAQLMAIYPLGLLDPQNSAEKDIINKSLRWLEKMGTLNWCGYSFSWAACIYARAKEADNAAKMLKIFASNFCSPNSFHLNGDQKGGQYSSFTYRPFTLEGNFAFAQGIHEMLIQSYGYHIEIFPAVPAAWKNVSFHNLRTEGAFLVSAKKENGITDEVTITAEQGGVLILKLPFRTWTVKGIARKQIGNDIKEYASVFLNKGQTITFKNGYE
jgi:alpha-L-fucosidase 2